MLPRSWLRPIFNAGAITFVILVTTLSSLRLEDIRFWDESRYLENGLNLGFGSAQGWELNPLYSDMYWALGLVVGHPIDTYFAGRATAAIIVVLSVWASLRMFTRPSIALAGGLLMSALPITYVWPGVSSPAAALLLLAIAVAWRWRDPRGSLAAVTCLWLASAIRPEFVWASLLGTALVLIVLVRAVRRGNLGLRQTVIASATLVGVPAILVIGYGNPTEFGSRSWEAFSQHYELRFAEENDDPWQVRADVTGEDFPGSTSIVTAALTNSPAFAVHVARNATRLPVTTGGHFVGLGGSQPNQNIIGVFASVIWIVAFVTCLWRYFAKFTELARRTIRTVKLRSSIPSLSLTVLIAVAALVPTVVIYPRPHYLVFFVGALVIASGFAIGRIGSPRLTRWLPCGGLAALMAVATLYGIASPATDRTANQIYAESLRQMNNTSTPWVLLTPERPITIYLNNGRQVLEPNMNVATFADLLQANDINVIFDGIPLRQAGYAQLEGFDEFLADPDKFGFQPILPGSPFLIHKDLT